MNSVLRPAITLLNRFRYPHKFLLIGMVLAVPMAFYVFLLILDKQADSDFIRKERQGVEYLQSLRQLLQLLPQRRGLTYVVLNGNETLATQLEALKPALDDAITKLEVADRRLGNALETTGKWGRFKEQWERLNSSAPRGNPEESYAAHTELIAELQDLIAHIGDTSNLILDPELDSYYLMDAVVNKLPALVESLGQLRGIGVGAAAGKSVEWDEKVRLINLRSMSLATLMAMDRGMEVAFGKKAFCERPWKEICARGATEFTGSWISCSGS